MPPGGPDGSRPNQLQLTDGGEKKVFIAYIFFLFEADVRASRTLKVRYAVFTAWRLLGPDADVKHSPKIFFQNHR
jgi:hypothetical protein